MRPLRGKNDIQKIRERHENTIIDTDIKKVSFPEDLSTETLCRTLETFLGRCRNVKSVHERWKGCNPCDKWKYNIIGYDIVTFNDPTLKSNRTGIRKYRGPFVRGIFVLNNKRSLFRRSGSSRSRKPIPFVISQKTDQVLLYIFVLRAPGKVPPGPALKGDKERRGPVCFYPIRVGIVDVRSQKCLPGRFIRNIWAFNPFARDGMKGKNGTKNRAIPRGINTLAGDAKSHSEIVYFSRFAISITNVHCADISSPQLIGDKTWNIH